MNADYFIPISEDKAKTIKVEDVEYLPVNQAPIDINSKILWKNKHIQNWRKKLYSIENYSNCL